MEVIEEGPVKCSIIVASHNMIKLGHLSSLRSEAAELSGLGGRNGQNTQLMRDAADKMDAILSARN